jgi:hypothetical protein
MFTLAGATPVVEWAVSLKADRNFCNTMIYLNYFYVYNICIISHEWYDALFPLQRTSRFLHILCSIPTRRMSPERVYLNILFLCLFAWLAGCAPEVSCIAILGESNKTILRQHSLSLFLVARDAGTLKIINYRQHVAVIIIVFGKFL